MTKSIFRSLILVSALLVAASAWAAGTEYVIRVDGLVCPYCAYGVEKKLNKIKGVEHVDVDLQQGIVTVDVDKGVKLTPKQMKRLFRDAGFTYRSMKAKAQ